ncbi:hypothetical protein ABL78_1327 [Leptomonas seymouri]|uniref:Guanine nucleotide-binding protein subunit beta-like protein n=1 Tax=Leptomonas seymouri TaxID=5684 RepID=A0A0N0P853_LEPSE|nr:hypothetical protein ABL78_1327 [Leptomonas seymouri]|eukprot:KPI89559.1 hypothetical protein ABL78_1327 [Leptomonas seymouri]
MLRRVAFTELPRDPQLLRVLHHTNGGVLIAAVAFKAVPFSTSPETSPPHRAPLFYTIVEMSTPNERMLPLRVIHVRVPRPSTVVNSITLLRSADGEDVYVVVQAAEVLGHQQQLEGAPKSVTTHVYRRLVVKAEDEDAGSDADGDLPRSEKDGLEEGDLISSPVAAPAVGERRNDAMQEAGVRVRYQRLPRAVAGADSSLWTAATAFSAAEIPIFGVSAHTAATSAAAESIALVTASGVAAAGSDDALSENQLQLWSLNKTRLTLMATCRVPALCGFPVSHIVTIPGTQDVAVLRCHNSLLEVDLAALRKACAHDPHTVTTNAFVTRAWRLSPHVRLTSCAVKDTLLYAGTEAGNVVVWDLRRPTSSAARGSECGAATSAQPQTSMSIKAPITGLYAPYATGFVTCDASGGVRDWRERSEMAEEDNNESSGAGAAAACVRSSNMSDKGCEYGVLHDAAGLPASPQFPYCSRVPVEAPNGGEGCVAMDGHGNLVAVVSECGRLCLYFCS